MFKKFVQRCLASLLVIIICCGAISPTAIYAAMSANHKASATSGSEKEVDTGLWVHTISNPYFYKGDNSEVTQIQLSTTYANGTDGKPWATIPFVPNNSINVYDSSSFNCGWNELRTLTPKDNGHDYTSVVLTTIDNSLGGDINDWNALMEKLVNLNNYQGTLPADVTTINQRMAAVAYSHITASSSTVTTSNYVTNSTFIDPTTKEIKWPSVTDIDDNNYSAILTATLEKGYTKDLGSMLAQLGIKNGSDDITDSQVETNGKINDKDFVYSVSNLGVLALNFDVQVNGTQTIILNNSDSLVDPANVENNGAFLANEICAYIILSEYADWALNTIPSVVTSPGYEQDEELKATLIYLRTFDEAFGKIIPVVDLIYNAKNPEVDKSIADLVNECSATGTMSEAFDVDISSYTEHTDTTSPITQFYTINSSLGITSYDRDAILADVEVNEAVDDEIQQTLADREHEENTTLDDSEYEISDTFLQTQNTVASTILGYMNDIESTPLLKQLYDNSLSENLNDTDITVADYLQIAFYNELLNHITDESYIVDVYNSATQNSSDASNSNNLMSYLLSGEADTLLQAIFTEDIRANLGIDDILTELAKYETLESTLAKQDFVWKLYTYLRMPAVYSELVKISNSTYDDLIEILNDMAESSKQDISEIVENTVNYGVDSNGVSTSYSSVTINKYIVEGMAYSATYVPMRTNIYSPDVIAQYKDGNETSDFYEFYIKYGFMRKALYMDTSSTSVMDYYNAGGVSTGTTKVCTLRDLIESKNNDVTLYIDSNFYNAEDAIETGNRIRENTHETRVNIYNSLSEFSAIWSNDNVLNSMGNFVDSVTSAVVKLPIIQHMMPGTDGTDLGVDVDEVKEDVRDNLRETYKFDISTFNDADEMDEYAGELSYANEVSMSVSLDNQVLKTNGYNNYSAAVRALMNEVDGSNYVNLSSDTSDNSFNIDLSDDSIYTDDNKDTIVLTSAQINEYLSGQITYSQVYVNEEDNTETRNTYTSDTGYSPLMSLAYVSCLYRGADTYTLANTVESNNPVFMASDDMCSIKEANQWYRNTLLNYMLLKNLKGNAQVDISYVTDLDCPVYMDIFGNILTESGIVVIPAASNATLHTGSFNSHNYAIGLYTCYGSEYSVPIDLQGAASVLDPYFVADYDSKSYIINGITMSVGTTDVRFDKIDTYSDDTKHAIRDAYKAMVSSGESTKYNWMAMVKIINEVMRGAPIEDINKDAEGLIVNTSKSGLVAAAKLESMLESLNGSMSNTLITIPDFTRMDNMEVWVALMLKLIMVATAAVIIIAIYQDGVSGQLGLRTFTKSIIAIALTVSCIVVIPAVFQLTYYSANKFLLENESMRILMVNEEKRQGGAEIGITEVNTVDSNGEFAIQLDWVSVPWYEEIENLLYESALDNVQQVKLDAYRQTATYNNSDVTMYNDGVYITTDDLFDSVSIDYTFTNTGSTRGLYFNSANTEQTASFYSPYYVFLYALVADVNEYNRWQNNEGDSYINENSANAALEKGDVKVLGSYNYTTKFMSGNRLKTVGLCKAYFESSYFMEDSTDILHLYEIYGPTSSEVTAGTANTALKSLYSVNTGIGRSKLFDSNIEDMRKCYWYDSGIIDFDQYYYDNLKVSNTDNGFITNDNETARANVRDAYVADVLENLYAKTDAMDAYARDFIASNQDLLGKVSDETFLKVMALDLAIKYNQLFGVTSANSLEIYNMDSEDLIRLCIVPADEAVMATSMSYSRFVYTFGGEAGVYLAAILSVIMWLGSFIKPLCTVLVFISVFLSIFVFRVVLRRPSANLLGYLITVCLLCVTNFTHALILKLGVNLPSFGLSPAGCLIFLIVGQVGYLILLAYVTGVSLKDWSNLGASEYAKEAKLFQNKFGKGNASDNLNGRIRHHEDNWDYYNDLVTQHRNRNRT